MIKRALKEYFILHSILLNKKGCNSEGARF